MLWPLKNAENSSGTLDRSNSTDQDHSHWPPAQSFRHFGSGAAIILGMSDGSVDFLPNSIDPKELDSMIK
jgi:hypothetical protein